MNWRILEWYFPILENHLKDNKHNTLHLVLKCAFGVKIFSKLAVFLQLRPRTTVCFSEQIMYADKNPIIFPCQMEALVYLIHCLMGHPVKIFIILLIIIMVRKCPPFQSNRKCGLPLEVVYNNISKKLLFHYFNFQPKFPYIFASKW